MVTLFGKTSDGQEVEKITLKSEYPGKIQADIITYGAAVQALHVADKDGKVEDVVLGFDTVPEYEVNNPYFGVAIGRVAGRISGAEFKLNGKLYQLPKNNGGLCLHGGFKGITRRLWKIEKSSGTSVTLVYVSADGEEGFPGELTVRITYSLDEQENALVIEYSASVTGSACPVMLTNHSYFNLCGAGNGVVDGHCVQIGASKTLPLGPDLVPTGEVVSLKNTAIDLSRITRLGERFSEMHGKNSGFDNYYILNQVGDGFQAEVYEPLSGRRMKVKTDQPGIQFYTANFLDHEHGKGGKTYLEHGALCLETHGYPNAINRPMFPSIVLNPGAEYHQKTSYVFDIQK